MKRDRIDVNDRQLACARISSTEGENYLKAMASAANYAWVNRSSMTFLARQVCVCVCVCMCVLCACTYVNVQSCIYTCTCISCLCVCTSIFMKFVYSPQAFAKQFNSTPDDLDMHVIYDVSHNIAKFEEHISPPP